MNHPSTTGRCSFSSNASPLTGCPAPGGGVINQPDPPSVAATAGLTWLDPSPGFGEDWNYRVQLGASVPLYRGGSVRAKLDQASARVEAELRVATTGGG